MKTLARDTLKNGDIVNHEFHGRGRVQYTYTLPGGAAACVAFNSGGRSFARCLPFDELEKVR